MQKSPISTNKIIINTLSTKDKNHKNNKNYLVYLKKALPLQSKVVSWDRKPTIYSTQHNTIYL